MLNSNSEELQSSITKFEQMLKTNRVSFFDAQEFEDLIVHYLSFGDISLAKKALQLGLNQHPSNIELMLLQSELLIMDEKFKAAVELLDYVEKISPLNEEVLLQRSAIASKKGDHKKSIELLHLALEITDEPIEIWNLLGMEHLLAENFREALYFFKNCLLEDTEDYPALYNLLYCYEQLKETDEAISVLNDLLEKDPYNEIAWHQLGKIFTSNGNFKEALSAFDFAIISDDSFTGAYIEKGKLLLQNGRINEAIENFELALNFSDTSAFIYQSIGSCHEKLGNDKLALNFYLKAIKVEPNNEKAWIALVSYYIDNERFQKAKYYIQKALKTNGDSIELWKKSAVIHEQLFLKEETVFAYQNAIDLGCSEWEVWLACIDGNIQLQEWEEALELAYSALNLFENKEALEYRIGGCCLQLGRMTEAAFFFENTRDAAVPVVMRFFPEFKKEENRISH